MTPQQLTLPPEAASVSAARRFVVSSLDSLGASAAREDAEMLVSEIATNAVLHARTPFTIEVSRDGQTVRVCVLDLSAALPRSRTYGAESTTGRGMRLIASLAADWGVEQQGKGRKTVWFELPADGSSAEVPAWDDIDVDTLIAGFGDEGDDITAPSARAAA